MIFTITSYGEHAFRLNVNLVAIAVIRLNLTKIKYNNTIDDIDDRAYRLPKANDVRYGSWTIRAVHGRFGFPYVIRYEFENVILTFSSADLLWLAARRSYRTGCARGDN